MSNISGELPIQRRSFKLQSSSNIIYLFMRPRHCCKKGLHYISSTSGHFFSQIVLISVFLHCQFLSNIVQSYISFCCFFFLRFLCFLCKLFLHKSLNKVLSQLCQDLKQCAIHCALCFVQQGCFDGIQKHTVTQRLTYIFYK